tara:strand:+ start:2353 stop:2634 length:282 start_codon:yes stop_codon:yes gene_type:complete
MLSESKLRKIIKEILKEEYENKAFIKKSLEILKKQLKIRDAFIDIRYKNNVPVIYYLDRNDNERKETVRLNYFKDKASFNKFKKSFFRKVKSL